MDTVNSSSSVLLQKLDITQQDLLQQTKAPGSPRGRKRARLIWKFTCGVLDGDVEGLIWFNVGDTTDVLWFMVFYIEFSAMQEEQPFKHSIYDILELYFDVKTRATQRILDSIYVRIFHFHNITGK